MSVNLLDLVKGAVGSQMGPISGILGESEQNTSTAVNAAVPAILGGLMKKASTTDGAGQIFKTLDDHDGGILDNIGGLLGGGNHTDVLNKGGGLLDMIFGGNRSALLGSLARIVGLGDSKLVKIMSLLAPVVMGVLGKQRRSQNLDISGTHQPVEFAEGSLGPPTCRVRSVSLWGWGTYSETSPMRHRR